MGMVACFAEVDPQMMSRLKADPSQIEEFLYPDGGEGEPEHYADLDKAWHCIHFMLTGSSDAGQGAIADAIFGGTEIGNDVGYGPARVLSPEQVGLIASALAGVSEDDFKSRFDPNAMQAADVYLSEMCAEEGDEALEYLVENYQSLVGFYRDAASRGNGAVLWVS